MNTKIPLSSSSNHGALFPTMNPNRDSDSKPRVGRGSGLPWVRRGFPLNFEEVVSFHVGTSTPHHSALDRSSGSSSDLTHHTGPNSGGLGEIKLSWTEIKKFPPFY